MRRECRNHHATTKGLAAIAWRNARACLAAREHFAEDLNKLDVPTLVLYDEDA